VPLLAPGDVSGQVQSALGSSRGSTPALRRNDDELGQLGVCFRASPTH
jgi:hypothetical protein